MRTFIGIFAALSCISIAAFADEPTFGPEFEFTNDAVENGNYGRAGALHVGTQNLKYQEKWAEFWEKLCKKRKDCEVEETYESFYAYSHDGDVYQDYYHPDYRITFDDGFWFELTLDPTVVEVKTKPLTLAQIEKYKEHIDEIFDTAKEVGLKPPKEHGGHISVGTKSAFGNDLAAYRNFLVEMAYNHQELGIVMGEDFRNAPPLAVLSKKQNDAFVKIIQDIDSKKIKDFKELKKRLKNEVYHTTYDPTVVSEFDKDEKYQAVNTTRLEKLTEFRNLPVQQNSNDFIAFVRIIHGTIARLKKKKDKIPLTPFEYKEKDHAAWVKNFESLIEGAGVDPADYYKYLAKKYKQFSRQAKCAKALKN